MSHRRKQHEQIYIWRCFNSEFAEEFISAGPAAREGGGQSLLCRCRVSGRVVGVVLVDVGCGIRGLGLSFGFGSSSGV